MFWKYHNILHHVSYTLFHVQITVLLSFNCQIVFMVVVQNDTQQSGYDPSLSAAIIRHDKIG